MNRETKRMIIRMLTLILVSMLLCRVSQGAFVIALALASTVCAISGKLDKFLVLYFLVPFLTVINPAIVPKDGIFGLGARATILLNMALLLIRGVSLRSNEKLPLGCLFLYMISVLVSSIGGWCPVVSFLKLLSFLLFILSLYLGSRVLVAQEKSVVLLRGMFLAVSIVIVFGSLLTLAFPSIGYMTAAKLIQAGATEAEALAYMQDSGVTGLLCGVMSHSQTLGTMVPCTAGWVLCDMLFVEKRASLLHMVLFGGALPLLYLSRARIALFSFGMLMIVLMLVILPRIRLAQRLRNTIKSLFYALCIFVLLVSVVGEVRSNTISKWLRKTDDISADTRGLTEAVTSTRQGSIEDNLYDFNKNPLWGMGFQVDERIMYLYNSGQSNVIISAPIEKGLLPLIVLGESGIIGSIVFGVFLINFYAVCFRRRYLATLTLFTVYLATNMAEGSFFSPLGPGGTEWLITVLGGFVVDMMVRHDNKNNWYLGYPKNESFAYNF